MSTAPFTREEQTDILRFLDYPDWQALGQSIQLGYPAASQPLFLVLDSLKRMAPSARPPIRRYLQELRCIEGQLSDSRSRLKATRVGDVTMNAGERRALREEYDFWVKKLADGLGVVPNPYAQRNYAPVGGLNAKVGG